MQCARIIVYSFSFIKEQQFLIRFYQKENHFFSTLSFFLNPRDEVVTKKMSCTLEVVGRSTCIICDSCANAYLCEDCANESRQDFFLLLLILLKDNAQNFESLRAKCMEISNVFDSQPITDTAQMFFDPRVHKIDNHAQSILETSTGIITSNTKAVEVIDDGNCGFHSFQVFYRSIDENEIRTRVIIELSAHEQYYNSLASQHGFDLVDDESVQDHVLRILNKGEYTGILTLSALASVFGCVADSIYPNINGKDEYIDVLNTSFQPRSTQSVNSDVSEAFHIRILWSGPDVHPGHDWHPNYLVPLLYVKSDAENSMEEQNPSILTTAEAISPLEVHHNLLQFKN